MREGRLFFRSIQHITREGSDGPSLSTVDLRVYWALHAHAINITLAGGRVNAQGGRERNFSRHRCTQGNMDQELPVCQAPHMPLFPLILVTAH